MMALTDLSPMELVDLVADGSWLDLTVEQAQEVDGLLRAHGQAVLALEMALEDEVRRLVGTAHGQEATRWTS